MHQFKKRAIDRRQRHIKLIAVLAISFICLMLHLNSNIAVAASSVMQSGMDDLCLDAGTSSLTNQSLVTLQNCNDGPDQSWTVKGDKITHYNLCLQATDGTEVASVSAKSCSENANQVWLRDKESYFNPSTNMCLTAQGENKPLALQTCIATRVPDQIWSLAYFSEQSAARLSSPCTGNEGKQVACYAEKEWTEWQSGPLSHEALLTLYTDGAPTEAWCADFVSYVYKEAGYPFRGAYDGWDESAANAVQNYGFTLHPAGQGYVPQDGDVAYFDYDGGHVEIVVSGGQHPTFIYGNSGTVDPTTGNGEMKANTLTRDGAEGQLLYYLSPKT